MRVDLFDFELPDALIAHHPVDPRDSARLLHVMPDGKWRDSQVLDLPSILKRGDVMVFNDTRVIPARLRGLRLADADSATDAPGAAVECLLHQQEAPNQWWVFAKPARKCKPGDVLRFGDDFTSTVVKEGEEGLRLIAFNSPESAFWSLLEQYGDVPLPPYIKRDGTAEPEDREHYQTLYAQEKGAVAAPTAGLHFTDRLFAALDEAGIERQFVTLHVGAGTFLPVKADDTEAHHMHTEIGRITPEVAASLNQARQEGRRIVAVGTTSMRLLESAADSNGTIHPYEAGTDLFITPGYQFKAVDVLMTNFHLPRSTLFMLVSAFSGLDVMQAAYRHAIETGYRFYSYGDACLLERAEHQV